MVISVECIPAKRKMLIQSIGTVWRFIVTGGKGDDYSTVMISDLNDNAKPGYPLYGLK